MRILVTGASGFVGNHVVADFASRGHAIVAIAGRHAIERHLSNVSFHAVDLTASPAIAPLLAGVDAVVHLAGKAHARDAATQRSYDAYAPLNRDAVAMLAQASADAGVRRFLLLSTIHVNGRKTADQPFCETSEPIPAGAYGYSKFEGEQRLAEIAGRTGMEWCIVRSPLVIGRGGKANLASLLRLVTAGLPLPLAGLQNRRSVVGLRNLSEFMHLCLTHPEAANELFLIADEPPVSSDELAARLASALGKPNRQFSVPGLAWKMMTAIPGLERKFGALWESLEADITKARTKLGWRQIHPLETAFADLAS